MTAAIYARVSTGEQKPDMQLKELRDYCARRNWRSTLEYTDAGISGAREDRPGLTKLLTDARRRLFDTVVVYRFDRFARSVRQLVNALEEFRTLGIQFASLHESVDTSSPNGRLFFHLFAAIAEFERELIRGRVRSGLAAARARGKKLGRPTVNVDIHLVARLRAQGRSWRAIANVTGIGVGTLRRKLLQRAKNLPEKAARN